MNTITVIGVGPASIELAKALKCHRNNPNADVAVGWGLRKSQIFDIAHFKHILNKPKQITRIGSKIDALRKMKDQGVPVPEFSEYRSDLDYPMLGRNFNHTQGQDIEYLENEEDECESDYYVQFIPVKKERRYHVFKNKVISATYKFGGEREGKGAFCRNYHTGWKFSTYTPEENLSEIAIKAVQALSLDFGAVDIIIGRDNKPYVLEVNTAPGLIPMRAEEYANAIKEWAGKQTTPRRDEEPIEEEPRIRNHRYQFVERQFNYLRCEATSREEAWDIYNDGGCDHYDEESDDSYDTEIECLD